jgi:hypothetical protein
MYEVKLLDLKTRKTFTKVFWNNHLKDNFIRKCSYSKKLKVLSIIDNTIYYD